MGDFAFLVSDKNALPCVYVEAEAIKSFCETSVLFATEPWLLCPRLGGGQ